MSFNLDNYEDVDTRLHRFYEMHNNGRIETEILRERENTEGRLTQVIILARVYIDAADEKPKATGHAEEILGSTPVNRTSMVENCETSAIGRALANAGFSAKGARASRQEMEKVERQTKSGDNEQFTEDYQGYGGQRQPGGGFSKSMMTKKQQDLIMKLVGGQIHLIDDYKKEHNIDGGFTTAQASKFIEHLKDKPADVDPWALDVAKGGADE